MVQFANSMYSVYFLALSLYLSKLQLICQAQQALATFKSFVLSLLLRLMRARDSNLSSICYFVSKFCIASVCICAITPTEVYAIKGCKQGSGWWPDDLLNVFSNWFSVKSNHLLGGGALTEDNESAGFKSFFYMLKCVSWFLHWIDNYLCLRLFKTLLSSLSRKGFH